MSRQSRHLEPNAIYHVTTHGLDDRHVYRDDKDRRLFAALLREAVLENTWRVLIACLMGTHFHLLLRTPEPNLDVGMRFLNGEYSRRFNRRYERRGHLWEERYDAEVVTTTEHLLECTRYIPLNPLEPRLAERPEDYIWCSYGATIRVRDGWKFVAHDELLGLYASTPDIAIPRYAAAVEDARLRWVAEGRIRWAA